MIFDRDSIRFSRLAKGLLSHVPGTSRLFCSRSGGTDSARYCYGVWLRHLVKAGQTGLPVAFRRVVELGPGDTFGTGLSAMLSGADEYVAVDSKPHAEVDRNLGMFEELIRLFLRREPIPGEAEFPEVAPRLVDYSFPRHLLSDSVLRGSLRPERLETIRRSLEGESDGAGGISIRYLVSREWNANLSLGSGLIDFVFSQAVMEHVDAVEDIYAALYRWLRPGGMMSHTIDYRSHGCARKWSGHWAISDPVWKIMRGKRAYFLNRWPHSAHVDAMKRAGFRIVAESIRHDSPIPRERVSRRFRSFSDDDFQTSGAFIQAVKPEGATDLG